MENVLIQNNFVKIFPGIEKSKDVIRVQDKAIELCRKIALKVPGNLPNNGDLFKYTICIELASRILKLLQPFPKDKAIASVGANLKTYQQCFVYIQNILGLKFDDRIEPRDLAVRFGCVMLTPFLNQTFEDFKIKYTQTIPPVLQKNIDFTNPVYSAAVFFLCAQKRKIKIDRKKLVVESQCSESDFDSVCQIMLELLGSVLSISKEKPRKGEEGKEGESEEEKKDAETNSNKEENQAAKNDEEEKQQNNNNNSESISKEISSKSSGSVDSLKDKVMEEIIKQKQQENESIDAKIQASFSDYKPTTTNATASISTIEPTGATTTTSSSSSSSKANNKKNKKNKRIDFEELEKLKNSFKELEENKGDEDEEESQERTSKKLRTKKQSTLSGFFSKKK